MKKNKQAYEKLIKNISTEELKEKLEALQTSSKANEETAAFIIRLTLGPLLAGLCFAFISLVPGLIISGILGSLLVVGCAFNAKSIKCDELIKKINAELENRVEQLALDDILKETYKPELVKKGKSKSIEKENKNDLNL